MEFINFTPHVIVLNNGTVIPRSGSIARVSVRYGEFDANGIADAELVPHFEIPAPREGVIYVVSGLAAHVLKRSDVVSPASTHPDCRRDATGQLISVPGFFRFA